MKTILKTCITVVTVNVLFIMFVHNYLCQCDVRTLACLSREQGAKKNDLHYCFIKISIDIWKKMNKCILITNILTITLIPLQFSLKLFEQMIVFSFSFSSFFQNCFCTKDFPGSYALLMLQLRYLLLVQVYFL